jgi:transposase
VCIVDKAGKVIREVKVATKPAEILAVLTEEALAIERIGLEAGFPQPCGNLPAPV